jgi:hypothetical protein
MHELDHPRRYQTIFVCGAFGVGSNRARDLEALRRFHEHLEPGGTLVLDNEVPYADRQKWRYWLADERRSLPEAAPPPGARHRAADGAEYELRVRTLAVDPLEQTVTYEMHALMWRDGQSAGEERYELTLTRYFRNELLLMLERAGFRDVVVRGGYDDEEPTGEHDFLLFVARKRDR